MAKKRNIKEILTSKPLIGAVFFAVSLWVYTTLGDEFVTYVDIPLSMKLPSDRAVENRLPEEITVEARGTGWSLFTLIFFNTAAECEIDLSTNFMPDSVYVVSRNEIIKSVDNLINVEAIDVLPETMTLKIGKIETLMTKVSPKINIKTRDGFIQVGDLQLKPDSVEITGNNKLIHHIKEWPTETIEINDAFQPLSFSVNLSDSLGSILNLENKKIKVNADIQMLGDITIIDVPVKLTGGSLPKKHILEPKIIDVSIRGGIEILSGLTIEDISVTIDSRKVLKDSTGLLLPKIKVGKGLEVVRSYPEYIYHYEEVKYPSITLAR